MAGHDESGGTYVEENGKKYKEFYGMSSSTAMDKHNGGVAKYRASEGKRVLIDYKGSINNTILDILGGLRSTCTYVGARELKELSKRRETLDKEKTDLNVREQVLKATENKIDKKVLELKKLQTQLEDLMKQYEQKENSKILSLVKIYETMKPKDAAKIFNELEMPVLLKVVSNMKEVKVAPVIASMGPAKARELSIEL